jgi:RNA polymerase sigma factor (sigma-70 family)
MTDEVLIKQFLAGHGRAFDKLVQRWQKPIYNFCLRYLGDGDSAKDVLQMTFIRVYHKLSTLEDYSKFTTWIYQISKNLCFDELKKRKYEYLSEVAQENKTKTESLATEELNPSQISEQNELVQVLKSAIQTLPEEERLIIILKTYHQLRFREIAEIIKIPTSTVKARMYKGLKALRPILNRWQIK